MRLDLQGPFAPASDPNLVTARNPFGTGTGPLGSSVNDHPGSVSVEISDHASAATTQGPPSAAGMRGAHRRKPRTAPLSPANGTAARRGVSSPASAPPPACR
jgi:hypothetical protein